MPLSLVSLIISNFIPVLGVLFFSWNASVLFFLYWVETLIIGIYNVIKMVLAEGGGLPATGVPESSYKTLKLVLIPFFCFHFGIFVLTTGTFIFGMLVTDLKFNFFLFFSILSLFISHGVSLVSNYIAQHKYERDHPVSLMLVPYGRLVLIIFSLTISGWYILTYGSTLVTLLILIVLKTIADILGHMFEYRGNNVYVPKPWANKVLTPLGKLIEPFVEATYRASVRSGKFEEISKTLSPEYAEYVKKYWDTPKDQRGDLVPPYDSLEKKLKQNVN